MVNCGCIKIYGEVTRSIEPVCSDGDSVGWNNPHSFKTGGQYREVGKGQVLSVSFEKGDNYGTTPLGSATNKLIVVVGNSSWLEGYGSVQSNLELFADIGNTLYTEAISGKIENIRKFMTIYRLTVNPANKMPDRK